MEVGCEDAEEGHIEKSSFASLSWMVLLMRCFLGSQRCLTLGVPSIGAMMAMSGSLYANLE